MNTYQVEYEIPPLRAIYNTEVNCETEHDVRLMLDPTWVIRKVTLVCEDITVPFTDEQVAGLRAWQKCDWVHPFTCCDHVTMEVSRHGFLCPKCGKLQEWAHRFMAAGPPPAPAFHNDPIGNWIEGYGYQEITGKDCKITLEPRPTYCDRGNWIAKLWPGADLAREIDDQDGWPRYFFDETRAKLECEAWLKKRGQA